MRWGVVFFVCLLALFALPYQAAAVNTWGCCVTPFGQCFDGSAFDSQASFSAACTAAGDSTHAATVRGQGSVATCTSYSECRTGCCCAGPGVFESPTINSNEELLQATSSACSLKPGFSYRPLPAGGTCVSVCGGAPAAPPPGANGTHTVSGKVINSTGGNPLPGTQVFMPVPQGDINATTDSAGRFTLRNVPSINARIFAINPMCQPGQSSPVRVDRDWSNITIGLFCGIEACTHASPAFLEQPKAVRGTSNITFTLSLQDSCADFLQFEPLRCDVQGLNCIALRPTTSPVVTDTGVAPNSTYCYKAVARFKEGGTSGENDSTVACVSTGDAACMSASAKPQWCGTSGDPPVSSILSCDDNNRLSPTRCDANTACASQAGKFSCASVPQCQKCNGLLGLFSRALASLPLPSGLFTTTCSNACTLDSQSSGKPLMVDAYASCTAISDCSDYHTQQSCTQDKCQIPGCSWTVVNAELGQGICSSPQRPACSSCASIFGYCNAQMCGKISPDCYFDGDANGLASAQGCIARSDAACRFYDNAQDCTAGAPGASYNIRYANGNRSGGDNTRTVASHDRLGIGACSWVANESICIKNADMAGGAEDDCIENGRILDDPSCLTDSTPPTTEFFLRDPPIYGRSTLRSLPYRVSDDKSPVAAIRTYVCFAQGSSCYPTQTLSQVALPPDGEYTMRYFSVDASENSEPVKEARLIVRETGDPAIDQVRIEEDR